MIVLKLCCNTFFRILVILVIISSLVAPPAFSQDAEDSQVFIAGFNAYQQKDYASAIEKMNEVLQKYPTTPLRDMALFWLSRSYFKVGNLQEAAHHLSQFSKEYPDNPLKSTVEEELLTLAARYEKGEQLPVGSPPAKQPDRLAIQKANAEKERIAAVKAEEAQKAAAAAEAARIAALKQTEDNAAAEKREAARIAAAKAEQARIAAAKAEQERIAAGKAEEARKAAATAEAARVSALKRAEDTAAAEKREAARIAAAKAEQARIAAAKAEQERIAKVKAEETQQAAATEAARVAALKQADETVAAEKRETARIAAAKADQERIAAIKAEQERIAAARAEEKRLAVAAKTEQDRLAAIRADEEVRAAATAEATQIAAEKAERERLALAKAEEAKRAMAAAESARLASLKADDERNQSERIAREAENSRLAALKAEETRQEYQKRAEEKTKAAKLAYREKAIGQYKAIIDKFPKSAAAATAAAKLRELGVAIALPPQSAEPPLPENAKVLRLEVAQFAGFEFNLMPRPAAFSVGRPIKVPFEIINRGNGTDSFYLESAFPAEFKTRFSSATVPGVEINQTPELAIGETFKGVVELVIPPGSIDGQRMTYPVKAASRIISEASQSREVQLVASAPLLRAVLRTDNTKPLPGGRMVYHVAILNIGSTIATDVTFRLNFPPQLEPVDYTAAGFRQEMKSALVFDGLQVNSGESRDFTVSFQLKDDSLAGQELTTRAELINNPLKTTAAFVSNIASVEPQRSIIVRTGSERLVAIPGQTLSVPFIVTNNGNIREKFKISSIITDAQDAIIYNDVNRDGIHQADEPEIHEIGPLAPHEEARVVVEIKTVTNAADGSDGSVQVFFVSEGNKARLASGTTHVTYSRPVLKMDMAGHDGRLKPGDIASFDLTLTNNGSNLARVVELQSVWPEQLELIAADPDTSIVKNGTIIWRFKEMGAAEKRSIKVSFRLKPGIGVGTAIQVRNVLTYEDQLGNRY